MPIKEPADKPPELSRFAAPRAVFNNSEIVLAAAVAVTEMSDAVLVTPEAVDPTFPIAKADWAAVKAVTAIEVVPVWAETAASPPDESALAATGEPVKAEMVALFVMLARAPRS